MGFGLGRFGFGLGISGVAVGLFPIMYLSRPCAWSAFLSLFIYAMCFYHRLSSLNVTYPTHHRQWAVFCLCYSLHVDIALPLDQSISLLSTPRIFFSVILERVCEDPGRGYLESTLYIAQTFPATKTGGAKAIKGSRKYIHQ